MSMDAAFTDTGRDGDLSERLSDIRFDTSGNFLASLSYTDHHRTLVFNWLG